MSAELSLPYNQQQRIDKTVESFRLLSKLWQVKFIIEIHLLKLRFDNESCRTARIEIGLCKTANSSLGSHTSGKRYVTSSIILLTS